MTLKNALRRSAPGLIICAIFAFVALTLTFAWQQLLSGSGKTVATYVLTGHPTVKIKIFGALQGHTFQVSTDMKGKRGQILSDLWSLPPNGGKSVQSDSEFCQQMQMTKTASGGGMPHEVYWTQDGTKCAFVLDGHLIAAVDIHSGAKIQYAGEPYESFHPRIRNYLSK